MYTEIIDITQKDIDELGLKLKTQEELDKVIESIITCNDRITVLDSISMPIKTKILKN